MLWDPLSACPKACRWLWLLLAVVVCLLQGPRFLQSLRPAPDYGVDFFQEWSSGRNYWSGAPIYRNLHHSIRDYVNSRADLGTPDTIAVNIEWNAHPPTSVLLGLPLAVLDYADAVLAWNLLSLGAFAVSLWLVGRQLHIPFSLDSVCPALVLLLLCDPFRQQVGQGQLNLFLLLLTTGVWVAERSGRPWLAGILLGVAAVVKLVPAFLFLYFALRRQGRVLLAGMATVTVLTLLTLTLLGFNTYQNYINDVVPAVAAARSDWQNNSLQGIWAKLFDPACAYRPFTALVVQSSARQAGRRGIVPGGGRPPGVGDLEGPDAQRMRPGLWTEPDRHAAGPAHHLEPHISLVGPSPGASLAPFTDDGDRPRGLPGPSGSSFPGTGTHVQLPGSWRLP